MTGAADVELLPLPKPWQCETRMCPALYTAEQVRANVEASTEALRALAGCAYQMAGFHDAPLVWLDRLSQAANGEPLPDPDTLSDELLPYQPDTSSDIEALRAEVEEQKAWLVWWGRFASQQCTRAEQAEARAERLEEALRDIANRMPNTAGPAWIAKTIAEAALHPTAAQENGRVPLAKDARAIADALMSAARQTPEIFTAEWLLKRRREQEEGHD